MQTSATTLVAPAHPFARFGAGPYKFAGLQTTEDRQALNTAAESAGLPFTTNMCGGSCDLCGTAIWNVFTFITSCGVKFKVGCECATKAGEGQQVKDGQKAHKRERTQEMYRRSLEARLAAECLANELLGHGSITNDQLVLKIEAERKAAIQARREASVHFGTVGDRLRSVELRYEGNYAVEDHTFGGWKITLFLRTVEGDNAVLWRTAHHLPYRPDGTRIEKGESFFATFTIKYHGQYKGNHPTFEKQTEVSRLLVVDKAQPKRARARKAKAVVAAE